MQALAAVLTGITMLSGCHMSDRTRSADDCRCPGIISVWLQDSLQALADSCRGKVGIALITDRGDTLTVNDNSGYPLMSVFKLHQAISLCHAFEAAGGSLDSVVTIRRDRLNPDTWSPMLKEHTGDVIAVSVRDLLGYALKLSDNNASNYLFDNMEPVAATDSFIATVIPRGSFRLSVTEGDMWSDHSLCYDNRSSPLGAAILINRLFTDSIIGRDDAGYIRTALQECKTGTDRIAAPLQDLDGVVVAHKTGSGFRDGNGMLTAHNDVAFVRYDGNRHYALAVLIKDFNGSEAEASEVIARISATIYSSLAGADDQANN